MVIKKKQLFQMQKQRETRFIADVSKKLAQKYPEFIEGKAHDSINEFIRVVLDLCKTYRITIGQNIRQIINILVEYQLAVPLPDCLNDILSIDSHSESRRTEDFLNCVMSGSYKLQPITLQIF
ncbi:MAG: hypothetical protein JST36_10675 [Bacteroidetes bacterium]|nr:hypothetical protein [Bacteroidota bacterium]